MVKPDDDALNNPPSMVDQAFIILSAKMMTTKLPGYMSAKRGKHRQSQI